ncbi:carbonic anhydrase family protein [Nitrosomonas sp. Nm33]|uniref:carbonic anhydrase family protein n=1 Tax=Nitrosomonas sp. Nm33 TaxID=133724 RepID=UPI000894D379|nr:carbonic anhydrase family protein [Nitrosomonas sp. Nm33]SDY17139.1 carbonic anhydrase [Nitrosomonas sp. Nm33]
MKRKLLNNLLSAVIACCATSAFSQSPPHWDHGEQATWWAIQDTTQVPPLSFPFAECGVGQHQSPVDLASATIDETELNSLEISYPVDNNPVFNNTGHAVQVNTSTNYPGALKVGEESFPLIQLHFHAPSEHVVGNTKFPAELHYVHVKNDGRLVVLAVAVNLGEENPTFQTILDNTPHAAGKNPNSGLQINPAALLPTLDQPIKYFTLAGSLTTPPCSEGVQWYILPKMITISEAQLNQLKTFYTDNNRLPQNLNGRSLLSKE